MEWRDEGILLSLRRHGESAAIAQLLTREHGRHAGLVQGAYGKRKRGTMQPGNHLQLVWRARLAEHLGSFTCEPMVAHGGAWLNDSARLAALSAACALVEAALPEREPHDGAFDELAALLTTLGDEGWAGLYVRWEVNLLAALGYGLDLGSCAATGVNDQLAYVSPRSGRAVSLAAGEAYRDRLLALPPFLLADAPAPAPDIAAGLALTGHFLERWVFGPLGHPLPPARTRLVEKLRA